MSDSSIPIDLAKLVNEASLDAYIISLTDAHLNEYVPAYCQRIRFASGFTGSAATLILCAEGKHQLFVDSRYHIQVEQEVDTAHYEIHKLGVPEVPSPSEWIQAHEQEKGSLTLGVDPFLVTERTYRAYLKIFQSLDSELVDVSPNLVDQVWAERPAAPKHPIYVLEDALSGESVSSKLQRVNEAMQQKGAELLVLTKLDEIAWLTNLRGSDIQCNPVFEAYAIVEEQRIHCFCKGSFSEETIPDPLIHYASYEEYAPMLESLAEEKNNIWAPPGSTTHGTYQLFQQLSIPPRLIEEESPISFMKAIKNKVEIRAIQQTHRLAASAKIKSFVALHQRIETGETVTEHGYSKILSEEYSKLPGFTDLSFESIVGFAANSAIVHYSEPSDQVAILPGQLLLIDSGIQASGGTTDDTRTLVIGDADARTKRCYTHVLKAHIRLAMQRFPEYTPGSALDAITRSCLWNEGMDFGHGTGHGVGAFLNVHEGPHGISPRSSVGFQAGMIVSNEPGYYEEGWGGIRLENLYVIQKMDQGVHLSGSPWLEMETLTLIPFAHHVVDFQILTADEKQWLSQYHQRVLESISSLLDADEQQWLQAACDPFVALAKG